MRRRTTTALLVAGIVLTLAVALWMGQRARSGDVESFGGTDAQATSVLERQGARPWFQPFFEPGSSELESGLFALQAGLGGIALGYCLGRLHGRRRSDGGTSPADERPRRVR